MSTIDHRRLSRNARFGVLLACALAIFAIAALPSVAGASGPQTRVVNGSTVPNNAGAWPYIAALVDDTDFQFCGGTLIAPNWVVTAAHCADGAEIPPPDAVIIGRKDLTTTAGERIPVVATIVHPGWDPTIDVNDIALLKLQHAPVAAPPPAVLASASDDPATDDAVMVAGWGTTSSGGPASDQLLEAQVNVVANATCDGVYGNIVSSHLCAAYFAGASSRDTCQGDSGGPLIASTPSGDRLAGITSFGIGCAEEPFPGVYTRVSSFVSWISGILGRSAGFSSTSVSFGTGLINSASITKQIAVTSMGTNPVTIGTLGVTGGSAFSIVSSTCTAGLVLASGESCSVGVAWTPTAFGANSASLSLTSNSDDATTKLLLLSGFGLVDPNNIPKTAAPLSFSQAGKSKSAGKKIQVAFKASYAIPARVPQVSACVGAIVMTGKIPGVKKSLKASASLVWSAGRCAGTFRLKIPKKAKHKKVAFSVRFAGNSYFLASERTLKLRVK